MLHEEVEMTVVFGEQGDLNRAMRTGQDPAG